MKSSGLPRELERYANVLMSQLAEHAAVCAFSLVSPRLARVLLMSWDRRHSKSYYGTQEFLPFALGEGSLSITSAAGSLQRAGLIEFRRGGLTVRNRDGLEAAALSCHAIDG